MRVLERFGYVYPEDQRAAGFLPAINMPKQHLWVLWAFYKARHAAVRAWLSNEHARTLTSAGMPPVTRLEDDKEAQYRLYWQECESLLRRK